MRLRTDKSTEISARVFVTSLGLVLPAFSFTSHHVYGQAGPENRDASTPARSEDLASDQPSTVPTNAPPDSAPRDNWEREDVENHWIDWDELDVKSALWFEYGLGYGKTQIGSGQGNANLQLTTKDDDGYASWVAAGASILLQDDHQQVSFLDFGAFMQGSKEAFPLHWADNEPDFTSPEIGTFSGIVAIRNDLGFFALSYDHRVYSGQAAATTGGSTLLVDGVALASGDAFRFGYTFDAVRFSLGQSFGPVTASATPRTPNATWNWRVEAGFGSMDLLAIRETNTTDVFEVQLDEQLSGLILGGRFGTQGVLIESMNGFSFGGYASAGIDSLADNRIAFVTGNLEGGFILRQNPLVARIYMAANYAWTEPYGSDRFAVRPLGGETLNFQIGLSVGLEF